MSAQPVGRSVARRGIRLAVIALVAATTALSATGCSTIIRNLTPTIRQTPTPSPRPVSSVVPKVGDCWSTTAQAMQDDATWMGSDPVDCSHAHQAYTFAVVTLTTIFHGSWQNSSSDPTLRDDVAGAAYDQCTAAAKDFLGELEWNQQLINYYFFVAPEAKWLTGDRTVRCDVATIAPGSPVTAEKLANLPPKIDQFVAEVTSQPKKYEFCVNAPGSGTDSGPLDTDGAVIADCRENPQWVLSGHGLIPGDAAADYPGDAAINSQIDAICHVSALPEGQLWYAYYPLEADWMLGNRSVQCWTGPADSGTSA